MKFYNTENWKFGYPIFEDPHDVGLICTGLLAKCIEQTEEHKTKCIRCGSTIETDSHHGLSLQIVTDNGAIVGMLITIRCISCVVEEKNDVYPIKIDGEFI